MDCLVNEEALAPGTTRFTYTTTDGNPLTWAGLIESWHVDEFADLFSESIATHPASAVRWESPHLTKASLNQPCEFVLVASPSLNRTPNPEPFARHLRDNPQTSTFTNLGGDATLIAPGQANAETNYTHLASFLRTAPAQQQRALWAAVADALKTRLSTKPVWLSTAGGGVAWLHVRLDDTPKYYSHEPYTKLSTDQRTQSHFP